MGIAIVWLLVLLLPLNFSFAQRTALCISQFALINQACAVLPSEQALRGQNRTRSQADDSEGGNNNDDDDDDENDEDDDDDDDGEVDESERRRRSGHKRSRGNKKSENKNKNRKKGNRHAKGRRKRGEGHDDEPRANKDCCRWLDELDESCVCGALLRLPPFLVKLTHKYSIKVGKSCKFTYSCYGI